jgi:hypothetical protein
MSVGDQKPCYTNLDSNNIHQLSHYSECNIKNVEPQVVCRMAHVLFTLFVNVCVYWCLTHIVFCFSFVFLCLVYPMLPVSLDCSFFLLPLRYSLTFIKHAVSSDFLMVLLSYSPASKQLLASSLV